MTSRLAAGTDTDRRSPERCTSCNRRAASDAVCRDVLPLRTGNSSDKQPIARRAESALLRANKNSIVLTRADVPGWGGQAYSEKFAAFAPLGDSPEIDYQ
jgi:hypothetical protein